MSVPGKVGDPVTLVMILEDGADDFYPQAEIYAAGGITPVSVINMEHKAKGRYEGTWIPTNTGAYSSHFFIYSDEAHTIESISYFREVEQLFISSSDVDDLASAIVRLLGLNHENAFIDNTVFSPEGQLIGARIRIFDSKEHTQLATDGGHEIAGLIATYAMSADYEGLGRLKSYRYVRD